MNLLAIIPDIEYNKSDNYIGVGYGSIYDSRRGCNKMEDIA